MPVLNTKMLLVHPLLFAVLMQISDFFFRVLTVKAFFSSILMIILVNVNVVSLIMMMKIMMTSKDNFVIHMKTLHFFRFGVTPVDISCIQTKSHEFQERFSFEDVLYSAYLFTLF